MSNNPGGGALAGLAGHYGSDSEEDNEDRNDGVSSIANASKSMWSICIDPTTGCPYYWDQITNQVSWELPPGVTVSTNTIIPPAGTLKPQQNTSSWQTFKNNQNIKQNQNSIAKISSNLPKTTETPSSDDEEEKIELITSYYNSDSASGEENEEVSKLTSLTTKEKCIKKKGTKRKRDPAINQPYGPEIPEDIKNTLINSKITEKVDRVGFINNSNIVDTGGSIKNNTFNNDKLKGADTVTGPVQMEKTSTASKNDVENSVEGKNSLAVVSDNLDDLMVAQASILKKLGELGPNDIKYLNGSVENTSSTRSQTQSPLRSPAANSPAGSKKSNALDMDVDDLIAQIEKEQPIDQPASDVVSSGVSSVHSQDGSLTSKSTIVTGGAAEAKPDTYFKPLFPSVTFSSGLEKEISSTTSANSKVDLTIDNPYKSENVNLLSDGVENAAFKRKRRIDVDIFPEKKGKPDDNLSYSTKYAQNSEISGERIGLGFSSIDTNNDNAKSDVKNNYPNFTKGDTLDFKKSDTVIECEKDDSGSKSETDTKILEETKNLIDAKLKFLIQNLPSVPPVQQLSVELQTLWSALSSGALQREYMSNWLTTADSSLARLEARAVSHPWICRFHSGAGCYVYEHVETGKIQWEHPESEAPPPPSSPPPPKPPAPPSPSPSEPTDMDISTTPPPQPHPDIKSHIDSIEPLPPGVETPTRIASPCLILEDRKTFVSSTDISNGFKQADVQASGDKLGAEIDSFYSDLAALEDVVTPTDDKTLTTVPFVKRQQPVVEDVSNAKEKKKKNKVKIPSSMKDKSVSKLVEKWKKVQETLDN